MISREMALKILKDSGCNNDVIAHCIAVSELAVDIAGKFSLREEHPDMKLIELGGLLHDLGRARTHGIAHAIEGVAIARELGLDKHLTEIIKRHIGAGISTEEAVRLGLPEDDYMPRTIEEKIVAHADNLTVGTRRITLDERIAMMTEKGIDIESINRVKALADEIGIQ
nr:TIGR00295 family protein [Methanolobus sp.]